MPEFTITRQIAAPVESVWEVLNDFGDIQLRYRQGWIRGYRPSLTARTSRLGPYREGASRHRCHTLISVTGGPDKAHHTALGRQMAAEGREARRAGAVEGYSVAQLPPEVGNGEKAHAGRRCGARWRMEEYG